MIKLLLLLALINPPTKTLTWDAFKGKPYGKENVLAVTWWKIDLNIQEENGKCTYEIVPGIDTAKSFTRTNEEWVLIHEQGHANLAVIYANRIQKLIAKYQGTAPSNYKKVERIYDSMCANLRQFQDLYDLRSDHGRSEHMQKKWNQWIDKELSKCP